MSVTLCQEVCASRGPRRKKFWRHKSCNNSVNTQLYKNILFISITNATIVRMDSTHKNVMTTVLVHSKIEIIQQNSFGSKWQPLIATAFHSAFLSFTL